MKGLVCLSIALSMLLSTAVPTFADSNIQEQEQHISTLLPNNDDESFPLSSIYIIDPDSVDYANGELLIDDVKFCLDFSIKNSFSQDISNYRIVLSDETNNVVLDQTASVDETITTPVLSHDTTYCFNIVFDDYCREYTGSLTNVFEYDILTLSYHFVEVPTSTRTRTSIIGERNSLTNNNYEYSGYSVKL